MLLQLKWGLHLQAKVGLHSVQIIYQLTSVEEVVMEEEEGVVVASNGAPTTVLQWSC